MAMRFPYQTDGRGRTAEGSEAEWIRGLIEQVLFTSPGERVMRPDFGSGVLQLLFAPSSAELAATTQMLIRASLQQWLAELISVEDVRVEADDASLRVLVSYQLLRTHAREEQAFSYASRAP